MMAMIHEYPVKSPASEKELGEMLRDKALGAGVLDIVVLESLFGDKESRRDFKLYIDSIHLSQDDTDLPYLIGLLNELIGDEEFPAGVARLEVTGAPETPEDERTLTLHTRVHEIKD